MKLKGLLITGATSALARSLVQEASKRQGLSLLAVSRGQQEPVKGAEGVRIKQRSGLDFTEESDLQELTSEIGSFFCTPFNVVHYAGDFWRHKPLLTTDFAEIKRMISSHFVTLCGVAKAVSPTMMRFRSGRLVAFSCNSVSHSYPDMSPFTSAKAAVESFVRCFSNEKAPFGISATAVALPTTRTEEVLSEKPDGDHENYIYPEELAKFILDHVLTQPSIATGNVVRVMKPSPTFYDKGYFQRNPRKDEDNKALEVAIRPSKFPLNTT